jgi:hypothetical protein
MAGSMTGGAGVLPSDDAGDDGFAVIHAILTDPSKSAITGDGLAVASGPGSEDGSIGSPKRPSMDDADDDGDSR